MGNNILWTVLYYLYVTRIAVLYVGEIVFIFSNNTRHTFLTILLCVYYIGLTLMQKKIRGHVPEMFKAKVRSSRGVYDAIQFVCLFVWIFAPSIVKNLFGEVNVVACRILVIISVLIHCLFEIKNNKWQVGHADEIRGNPLLKKFTNDK